MIRIIAMGFAFSLGITALQASDIETISKTAGILPPAELYLYKELFGLRSFIETGTYAGDTTAIAAQIFEETHSIEIFEPLHIKAKERFSLSQNVVLYLGDTVTQLSQMIENSSPKRLYWLDAHSSGESTGGVPGFSPILDELDQILCYEKDLDSIILIDDLRGMCHCDDRTNLPLRLIIQKIKEISPDLQFYSIGDIGIIFNEQTYSSISVSEVVKNASLSRFFDPECKEERLLEELIDAESFIARINEETSEGINFRQLIKWVNKKELGGEVIYLLWEALYELENNDVTAAIQDLQLVSNSFYSHWRIDAYLVKALILDGQIDKAVSLFNEKLLPVYKQHPKIIKKIIDMNSFYTEGSSKIGFYLRRYPSLEIWMHRTHEKRSV